MTGVKISQHANERMLQMGVTRGEVDSVRTYPERTYWSAPHHSMTYQGRRIAIGVVTDEKGEEWVATVLWRDADVYPILSPQRRRMTVQGVTL